MPTWTSQIDVMLLPYDPVAFGSARGSGIFTESVASGRPIIASRGTFAGASVEKDEAEGEVFAPHTSEELAAAIVPAYPTFSSVQSARGGARQGFRAAS